MERRRFLTLLGLAPIAAPALAKEIAKTDWDASLIEPKPDRNLDVIQGVEFNPDWRWHYPRRKGAEKFYTFTPPPDAPFYDAGYPKVPMTVILHRYVLLGACEGVIKFGDGPTHVEKIGITRVALCSREIDLFHHRPITQQRWVAIVEF